MERLQGWINACINARDAAKLVLQKESLRTSSIDILEAAKDLVEGVPKYIDCNDIHDKVTKTIKDTVNPISRVQQVKARLTNPSVNQDANNNA